MSHSLTFYFTLPVRELELKVTAFQEDFELLLGDSFSESELEQYGPLIDSMAAVYVQPVFSELTFEDFYPDLSEEEKQRNFFEGVKSSVAMDHVPFLENHPFQISYLRLFLERFPEVMIDRGGVQHLVFKEKFLQSLDKFKGMGQLMPIVVKAPIKKSTVPVTPMDFLFLDIDKEMKRLGGKNVESELPSEKLQKLYRLLKTGERGERLFSLAGLSPKDFDDLLEKLKFTLRKLP